MNNNKSHNIYIQTLKKIGAEKRLLKALELSELTKELFISGLRKKYPDLSEKEFKKILLEKLEKCHNSNY